MPQRVTATRDTESGKDKASARPSARPAAPAPGPAGALLSLQRSVGNRALSTLVQPAPGAGGVVQRARKGKGKNKNKRAAKKRRQQGSARGTQTGVSQSTAATPSAPGQQGWLGWLGSFLPGTTTYEPPSEEEEEDEGGQGPFEDVEEEGGSEEELALPGDAEEVKTIGEKLLEPFAPESITIELGKASGEAKGTRLGDLKGSLSHATKGDGTQELSTTGSVKGRSGQASGEGKVAHKTDSLEGEGKVEMLLGVKREANTGTFGWDVSGHKLQGDGKFTYRRGLMAEGELKAKYDLTSGDLVAAAKAGAFAGAKSEGTVTIKFLSGGKDYGAAEGKVGLTFGIGGEVRGAVSWSGGVLDISTGGDFAFGVGTSYHYKLSLNTTNLVQAAPGLLWSLWSWMTTVPEGTSEEDFWL